jgi:hypothetical protein
MAELESHDYETANMKELSFRSHLQKVNRDAGHLGFNDVMVIAGLWPAWCRARRTAGLGETRGRPWSSS